MNTTTLRFLATPALLVGLAAGIAACGDDSDDASGDSGSVTVTEAWVRSPAAGQPNAAGYGTITNDSDDDVVLTGASADIQATFEIHETLTDDDGVMSMQERENGFMIGAGESLTLAPGGPHVMMLGIDETEFEGDGFDLTFVFDGADEVTAFAEIRTIEGMDDMDHGDMEMDDMDSEEMDDMDSDDMDSEEMDDMDSEE